MGAALLIGWLEPAPVRLQGREQRFGREVRGERVGEAQHARELRAEEAGAQDPQRNAEARPRHRLHDLPGLGLAQ